MTTVMSKLRDISERTGIPYHSLTKTISGTIVALYAAKLSYPYVEKYLASGQRSPNKKHELQNNHNSKTSKTQAKNSKIFTPDNDETLGNEFNHSKSSNCKVREDDVLVQMAEAFDRRSKYYSKSY